MVEQETGCFHCKFILLRFVDRLRIVISSANLYANEWEHIRNCIWAQDFFPKNNQSWSSSVVVGTNDFADYFRWFCDRIHVDLGLFDLDLFQLERANARLVGSIPGFHASSLRMRFGIVRLGEVLRSLPPFGR